MPFLSLFKGLFAKGICINEVFLIFIVSVRVSTSRLSFKGVTDKMVKILKIKCIKPWNFGNKIYSSIEC